ncbi:membrane protein [Erwinia typographi]|uniref:Membrane protein n=1 Tax=Erwinia typographi TaxID=371042 RepID=A0A0A3YI64_9GAMM|nr:protein YgfX [Erwinia typographi]KGT86457.1 membrane protein [Erwinia typographi]
MALWHSDLRVSWRAQWVSLLLHGVVILVLLLAPWPASLTVVWMLLLTLVVFECVRSQRRIRSREGEISLLEHRQLQWRQKRWQIHGRPWITQQAILLALRSAQGEKEKLWLCRDSMEDEEWRELRQHLLMSG